MEMFRGLMNHETEILDVGAISVGLCKSGFEDTHVSDFDGGRACSRFG
jgi:hypothetical protein